MANPKTARVGLVWAQFAAYHIDRCEAVARRLVGRAEVLAVEVATTSADYAWEASGDTVGARKVTLFPGRSFDAVPTLTKVWAMYRALRRCNLVCFGLGAPEVVTVLTAWLLRLSGVRVFAFSESKFDDRPRRLPLEMAKSLAMTCYGGMIVGAGRHVAYARTLGFRRRPVLPGTEWASTESVPKERVWRARNMAAARSCLSGGSSTRRT